MNQDLISWMILLPLIAAVLQALVKTPMASWISLLGSAASSVCAIATLLMMQPETAAVQGAVKVSWISVFSINYSIGTDGLSVLPVLLVAIIFPVLIAAEWNRSSGKKGFHGLLLFLQGMSAGAVCSQDLFLMFFFWAATAIPYYFLVGIWGGKKKEDAALQGIGAAALGNSFFFGALVLLYYSVHPHAFSVDSFAGGKLIGQSVNFFGFDMSVSGFAFFLVSVGLALRIPIWPTQGWYTQMAEEAPATVFVTYSGITIPVGITLFIKMAFSLFPDTIGMASSVIVLVGTLNLIMGGLCALNQRELKRMVAFITIGQIGLILIGIGSLSGFGSVGAIYANFALGLGISGFGLFSGIIYQRTGSTAFRNEKGDSLLGGVAESAPILAGVAGVIVASLMGIPGLAGFVGGALLMIGSYTVHPIAIAVGGVSMILATYYLLSMYRSIFLGKPSREGAALVDLTLREQAFLFPVMATIVFFGVYPKPVLELVRATALALVAGVK